MLTCDPYPAGVIPPTNAVVGIVFLIVVAWLTYKIMTRW